MPTRTHDGIKKRCDCGPKEWPRCSHPWHFNFSHPKHRPPKGTEWRFNLNERAGKARGYVMPKTEAREWRERFRSEIAAGTFKLEPDAPSTPPLTFGDLCDRYIERHVNVPTRRERAKQQMLCYIAIIRRSEVPGTKGNMIRIEDRSIGDVTKADIDAVRASRLADATKAAKARRLSEATDGDNPKGRPWEKAGEVGINRLLARWRHIYNWAIVEGHADRTPFKRAGVTVVKLNRAAETPRDRRLAGHDDTGEEARLLRAIQPYPRLQAMFIAALETGCRSGELVTLQWRYVDLRRGTLTLVSTRTKTSRTRTIPITTRLRAVLDMRRTLPDGTDHKGESYVFGNELGEPINSYKAEWKAVRQAAGIKNLKFHDLRREFGSRLLEAIGGNTAIVRDWLGHAALSTTDRYLVTTATALAEAGKRFETARKNGFAQDSHKPADQPVPADQDAASEVSEKSVN